MKWIKKQLPLLTALALIFTLCACGGPAESLPGGEEPSLGETVPAQEDPTPPEEAEEDPAQPEEAEEVPPDAPPVQAEDPGNQPAEPPQEGNDVSEDGWYSSKEEVAAYINEYGHLPDNYVTKREAEDAGWSGGSVEPYTGEGTAIGGSRFGNREGLLPEAEGRKYTECDIDTVGKTSRGAKRIVFSNDGLIYYTGDHYESFELLYGEP